MRNPEVREIGKSLLFIFSKEDSFEVTYTGAYPRVYNKEGNTTQEEQLAAIDFYLSHPIHNA